MVDGSVIGKSARCYHSWPLDPALMCANLAWLQWGAGVLDTIENLALLRLLRGPVVAPWP